MDTRRPHRPDGAGDASDDLIAELARLVGQQSQTGRPGERQEPSLTRDESDTPVETEPRAAVPPPPAGQADRVEPDFSADTPGVAPAENSQDFEFDFGFNADQSGGDDRSEAWRPDPADAQEPPEQSTAQELGSDLAPAADRSRPHAPQPVSDDPIADLIANSEQEFQEQEVERWNQDDAYDSDSFDTFPHDSRTQGDHYGTQPVSAVAPGAVAPAALRDRDPLSEIEALIGEAAKVNVEPGPMGARRVRSVYAPEPARRAAKQDPQSLEPAYSEDNSTPAERAILAAAAASGGQVGRAEPEFADFGRNARHTQNAQISNDDAFDADEDEEDFVQRQPARHRRRRRGGVLVPAALGSLLLVAAVGGYVMFFGGEPGIGEAPVLVADSEPAKADPEPTNTTGTTGESVVFSDIEGQTTSAEDSTLVSRDETAGASGAEVSDLLVAEESDDGLANRRVRTVTVRPDGTIVSGDEVAAGSSVLPVDRPDVPEVPNSTLADDPIANAITAALGEQAAAGAGADPLATQVAALAQAEANELSAAAPATETTAAAPATGVDFPLPQPRPAALVADAVPPATAASAGAAETTADAASTEVPLTTPESPAGPVGAWVQLSSQRTEEAARAGIPELQSRFGTLFNGAQMEVNSVDLGEQGVYYRVRLPQPGIAEANSVCGSILSAGGDCFVIAN